MSKPKEPSKARSFFRGVRAEMRKVTWPTRKELVSYTGAVIFLSAVVAVIVGILDLVIHWILGFII